MGAGGALWVWGGGGAVGDGHRAVGGGIGILGGLWVQFIGWGGVEWVSGGAAGVMHGGGGDKGCWGVLWVLGGVL